MSYEYVAAPHTFQHDTEAILAKYPQRLSTSELTALGEMRAAGHFSLASSYQQLKRQLADHIRGRAENRAMVQSSQHSRMANYELRRLAQIETKARQKATAPTREQRPSFVTNAQKEGAPV